MRKEFDPDRINPNQHRGDRQDRRGGGDRNDFSRGRRDNFRGYREENSYRDRGDSSRGYSVNFDFCISIFWYNQFLICDFHLFESKAYDSSKEAISGTKSSNTNIPKFLIACLHRSYVKLKLF